MALDKKINELEKSGDFKVIIVKSNTSESIENKETVVAKSLTPKTQSLTPIPSSLVPDTQSLAPKTSSLAPKPSSLKPSTQSRTSNPEIYIVKSGDNLWKIARKNDTRVKVIIELNNLKSNKLKLGQKLIIPSSLDSSRQLIAKTSSLTPNPSSLTPRTSLPKSESQTSKFRNPEIKTVYDFISDYISAYKLGELNRIEKMFSKNATENGVSIAKALASYSDIFNNKKIIKYDILIERINIKSEKSHIDGDFIITFKNLDKGNTKTSKGSINWVLDWKNDSWKIDQLNYQLKDTIFTDESL